MGTSTLWDGGIWIVDILGLAENFDFISFNYVRREINQLAHKIAKFERKFNMFYV